MNITPLASESLGVRSSAVFVETSDVKILIDPGVSLAPLRFGLPPHPIEIRRMNELWLKIKEYAARADILIITHYHFDHFDHTEPLVFQDKVLLLKHPKEIINSSQRQRAKDLRQSVRSLPKRIEPGDGASFEFRSTVIRFSPAVPHGPGPAVGWVIEVSVRDSDSCFLYTSDVQGASLPEHVQFILSENPDMIYLDGPLTYMMGHKFSREDLGASIRNVCEVLETTRTKALIIDHHLLRDRRWKEEAREVFLRAGRVGKKVVTAAEFSGQENMLLEANRRQLFEQYPDMPEEPLLRSRNFHLAKELERKSSL